MRRLRRGRLRASARCHRRHLSRLRHGLRVRRALEARAPGWHPWSEEPWSPRDGDPGVRKRSRVRASERLPVRTPHGDTAGREGGDPAAKPCWRQVCDKDGDRVAQANNGCLHPGDHTERQMIAGQPLGTGLRRRAPSRWAPVPQPAGHARLGLLRRSIVEEANRPPNWTALLLAPFRRQWIGVPSHDPGHRSGRG